MHSNIWITYELCKRLQRSDVYASILGILSEHSQNGELGTDRFTTSCWSSDKHVIVAVVDGVENCTKQQLFRSTFPKLVSRSQCEEQIYAVNLEIFKFEIKLNK